MEFKKFIEQVKAETNRNKDLFVCFKEVEKAYKQEQHDRNNCDLMEITQRVCKKSKRVVFEDCKVKDYSRWAGNTETSFGINSSGLGIKSRWGEQLETLGGCRRYGNEDDKKIIKKILTDEKCYKALVGELSKPMVKILKKMRTFYLKNGTSYKEKISPEELTIDLGKIVIELGNGVSIRADDSIGTLRILENFFRYDDELSPIISSKLFPNDNGTSQLSIEELQVLNFIFENKQQIKGRLNSMVKEINRIRNQDEKERKFLAGILEPFKAMENL